MLSFLKEFWEFVSARKKYWLYPLMLLFLLLGFFVVVTEGTVIAPFIYTIF